MEILVWGEFLHSIFSVLRAEYLLNVNLHKEGLKYEFYSYYVGERKALNHRQDDPIMGKWKKIICFMQNINPYTSEVWKWTCPSLNMVKSTTNFRGVLTKTIEVGRQEHRTCIECARLLDCILVAKRCHIWLQHCKG